MGRAAKLRESKKAEIRLDFGCGPSKLQGFIGVDSIDFPGVDVVLDVTKDEWPWKDGSVIEARASHFIEHLDGLERVKFFNNLYRILEPGGKFEMICPYWGSSRAYGDFTHKWPPIGEMSFYYFSREWRLGNPEKGLMPNAPHNDIKFNPQGYTCDFEVTWGYAMHPTLLTKTTEVQQFAIQNYKEAAQDVIAHFTKR